MLRFAFILSLHLLSSTAIGVAQTVEIEVNNSPSEADDYLCWSPTPARVRLAEPAAAAVPVRLSSAEQPNGGSLVFDDTIQAFPSVEAFMPQQHIDLVLPLNGVWVPFQVAGVTASVDGKDVSITVTDTSGTSLGQLPVMVRVRKNADDLEPLERNRFLTALATLHGHQRLAGPRDAYEKYATAHGVAFSLGIHSGSAGLPLFLAWHRAFLLSLERELQAVDPRVALPYWRFDEDSNNIFRDNFMGLVNGPTMPGGSIVAFDAGNPLFGWRMSTGGPLVREGNPTMGLQAVYPAFLFDTLPNLFAEEGIDQYQGAQPENGANGKLEQRHHNYAHVANGGWLGSGTSPRDPLFFMLHTNVDRAWAEWQARFDRFDTANTASYFLQGSYPGATDPNRLMKGSYANDAMWPWSQDDGASTPSDPRDDWPGRGWAMPASLGGHGPDGPPTPASMIDYLSLNGGTAGHGSCYNDLRFER